jgi:hypothetical protein
MKTKNKWAIVYSFRPYPRFVGEVLQIVYNSKQEEIGYEIDTHSAIGKSMYYKRDCDLYNSESEAKDVYYKFTRNKMNYAPEG